MKINHKFYLEMARRAERVYKTNTDLGTVEYSLTNGLLGEDCQVLAITGSNEWRDWFLNLDLRSKDGIKRSSWSAAHQIHKAIKGKRDNSLPLYTTGHSKGGATAIAYHKLFGSAHTMAFCPARSLKKADSFRNLTTVIDPDDPVPMMGYLTFKQPKCRTLKLRDDHWGTSAGDHVMGHVVRCIRKRQYKLEK